MSEGQWVKELPAEVMVCDANGTILEMNDGAVVLFEEDGGRSLLGSNVLACHSEPSRLKLEGMLEKQTINAYFNTENGEKRFFFQSPWYKDGRFAGFVEFSFAVPQETPNFIRE